MSIVSRDRKSRFVKLFDKTPPGVVCPHFYELVLSNGCPYDCSYCYLKLTFRGKAWPVVFTNDWDDVKRELDCVPHGVFATGELADSLAVEPPLLSQALDYFARQEGRRLLLLTKSANIQPLLARDTSPSVIVSFSLNSDVAARLYEHGAAAPRERLRAAYKLQCRGWRVRIRLDPMIPFPGWEQGYAETIERINALSPEMVTLGALRASASLPRHARAFGRDTSVFDLLAAKRPGRLQSSSAEGDSHRDAQVRGGAPGSVEDKACALQGASLRLVCTGTHLRRLQLPAWEERFAGA